MSKGNKPNNSKVLDIGCSAYACTDSMMQYDKENPETMREYADAQLESFNNNGGVDKLDEAIFHSDPNHPRRSLLLNRLGIALQARFGQSGHITDLDQAILHHQDALALHPPGHSGRSISLNNLARVLHTRFKQSGNRADLDQAILYHQDTLALCPPGHSDHSMSLSNLANALHTCFKQSGNRADLDQAILHYQEALMLCPADYYSRFILFRDLANALKTCFEQSAHMQDLEGAIHYITCSLQALPPGHPMITSTKMDLASYLLLQHDYLHPENNHLKVQAFALLEEAVNHSSSSILQRFKCAVQWAHQAHHCNNSSTLVAYSQALTLLHTCLSRRSSVQSQHQFLVSNSSRTKFFASNAAACAIADGQLEHAIESFFYFYLFLLFYF
jgi:hypothetical protein